VLLLPWLLPTAWSALALAVRQVTSETQAIAHVEMDALLKEAYEEVRELLARNRGALDAIIVALMEESEVRAVRFAARWPGATSFSK
jgi:ATP-dependent Zn protease